MYGIHVNEPETTAADQTAAASSIEWLTVPDICEQFQLDVSRVRRLLSDRAVIGLKIGKPAILNIPGAFFQLQDRGVDAVEGLSGTITLLTDAGIGDEEIIDWLHTEDPVLGTTPIIALRDGRRKPVRRAAQLFV